MAQCGVSTRLSHLARVQIPSCRRDMWVEFVMGSFPCFERVFFAGTVLYSNAISLRSLCGCAAFKLFIHSFIYLFIYLFMVVN